MAYVDGYVLAVKSDRRDEYLKMARRVGAIFLECGATRVVECWGDDVPEGKHTSFPMAVQCAADETVVFSWIEWPSKAARDQGNARLVDYPEFDDFQTDDPVVDGKRMILGGFVPMVDLKGPTQ